VFCLRGVDKLQMKTAKSPPIKPIYSIGLNNRFPRPPLGVAAGLLPTSPLLPELVAAVVAVVSDVSILVEPAAEVSILVEPVAVLASLVSLLPGSCTLEPAVPHSEGV
jgi:hypothetical protein